MSAGDTTSRGDYIAPTRSERSIARRTSELRRAHGSLRDAYFNVVKFFDGTFSVHAKCGPISLILFDAPMGGRPAFVRHKPARLSIDSEIWKLAEIGDPDARDIVGHELGHLDMHSDIVSRDSYQQSFSVDPSRIQTFAGLERSAEWQADRFRDHLLVPDDVAASLDSAAEIAAKCSVPLDLAQRRFGATRTQMKAEAEAGCDGYASVCCPHCARLTMKGSVGRLSCDTCGYKAGQ